MYFDYAATTPPSPEVLKTFDAVNRNFWANPESLHRLGARSEQMLEQARKQVLELLGAEADYRCVFTSGATESNNMALAGAATLYQKRGRHVITTAIEHPSVLEVFRGLESVGFEVTVLPVNTLGEVEPDELASALRADTTLVSIMHVNNEVGAINDIIKLGAIVKANSAAAFHVDAAQSVGKFPIELNDSPIDMLTFSAHKFFGLKGSGALLIKSRFDLPPMTRGGGQEGGLRPGTADPARAAALAKALRLSLESRAETFERVMSYKQTLVASLAKVPDVEVNGSLEAGSPFILNCSVAGTRPETVLQALSEEEIYISTVSACSAKEHAESAVVRAITGDRKRAATSIRISLAGLTTREEVDALCTKLVPLIEIVRFKKK